jgi:hypothetical protein
MGVRGPFCKTQVIGKPRAIRRADELLLLVDRAEWEAGVVLE